MACRVSRSRAPGATLVPQHIGDVFIAFTRLLTRLFEWTMYCSVEIVSWSKLDAAKASRGYSGFSFSPKSRTTVMRQHITGRETHLAALLSFSDWCC